MNGYDALAQDDAVKAFIEEKVTEVNEALPSYEQIKRIILARQDFSEETGELTPTLKVKRKVVTEMYQDDLDGLYQEKF